MSAKEKVQGAQAPYLYYSKIKLTGNEWFQWYKQYIDWLQSLPKNQLRRLEIMGLTEHYYLTYVNPLTHN